MADRRRNAGEGNIVSRTVILADGKEKTYWQASVRHNGKRHFVSAATRPLAVTALKELRKKIEAGQAPSQGSQTVQQFCDEWLESSVKPTMRPRSFRTYCDRLRLHIYPDLGKIKLANLTARDLQLLYARKLAAGLSSTSIASLHATFHRALDQALRWELISKNPSKAVDVPKPRTTHPKPLDEAQLQTLFNGTRDDLDGPLWTVLALTGLRFGEAAALRWRDVDFDQRVLFVRSTIVREGGKGFSWAEPKTPKSRRVIPLPAAAIVALRRQQANNDESYQLAHTWEVPDLVFPSGRGTPMRESKLIVRFHETLEKLGLERRRLHDLRHTYATRLFALDVHPRAAQELLGHANITTTMGIYTSSVSSVLREAVDRLDAVS